VTARALRLARHDRAAAQGPIRPKDCAHVFFMHVPKTGGVSLSAFLGGMFSAEDICPAPTGDGRWRHNPQDVAGFRFFTGHFDVDFIDALDPAGFKMTILRNPRDRIVSVYDFWRSVSPEWSARLSDIDEDAPSYAKSVDFSTFLASDKYWVVEGISNSMARQLLGAQYVRIADNESKAARAAFDRLLTFDWFTTTESLSEDFASLASLFGAAGPDPSQTVLNKTYLSSAQENRVPVAKTTPTRAELRRIDRSNRIDAELYRMAVRHRERREGLLHRPSIAGRVRAALRRAVTTVSPRAETG
jgi:hypothetical protein